MKKVMASGTFDLLHPGHGVYLEEAKNLGGYNSKLYVVVARDSTVEKRKRVPIVGENQRLELIKMLKPVDEAYLGNEEGDIFKIVKEIDPDIIAIGPDQTHNVEKLQKAIDDRGLRPVFNALKFITKMSLTAAVRLLKRLKILTLKVKY